MRNLNDKGKSFSIGDKSIIACIAKSKKTRNVYEVSK